MGRFFGLLTITASMYCTCAQAVPNCWGVMALNANNKKVARIACKADNSPGTAQNYKCTYNWKIKTKDGIVQPLSGSFVVSRGDPDTVKYEEYRIEGQEIEDEVDGIVMSCAAKP